DTKHSFTLQNIASSTEDEVGSLSLSWDTLELLSLSSDGSLTVNGIIESTTGGIKFPDGTIQTTAGTGLLLRTASGSKSYFIVGEAADGDAVGIININKYLETDGTRNLSLNQLLSEYADKTAGVGSSLSDNGGDIETSSLTAFGYLAGFNNEATGYHNTFIGVWAGYTNTTGRDNTATGYRSLYRNVTGRDNTANGFQSLYENTT
ncbi:MAG: hypothetical protein GY727_12400, partial [Gammaproteobacteria bacterium]|nr:hypothetical protein [Gammaproteobacteria bacterium]